MVVVLDEVSIGNVVTGSRAERVSFRYARNTDIVAL